MDRSLASEAKYMLFRLFAISIAIYGNRVLAREESAALEINENKIPHGMPYLQNRNSLNNFLRTPTCEKFCNKVVRKRSLDSIMKDADEIMYKPVFASSQGEIPSFPTSDPSNGHEKKIKGQKNKPYGRANKNQKNLKKKPSDSVDDLDGSFNGKPLSDKKNKKKLHSKKSQLHVIREGQTARRLRQHVQHKKKVKKYLRKRIQEQIEQRSQNLDIKQ